MEYNVKIDLKK